MRTMPFVFAATLGLAACASTTPAPDAPEATAAPPSVADACRPENAQSFVGQKATPESIEAARVAAGAAIARALRPGTAVTMEYRGDRLNLHTDTNDVVTSVGCG